MRTIILPYEYYLGYRYLVIKHGIPLKFFYEYEDAQEYYEKHSNAEIIKIAPFK